MRKLSAKEWRERLAEIPELRRIIEETEKFQSEICVPLAERTLKLLMRAEFGTIRGWQSWADYCAAEINASGPLSALFFLNPERAATQAFRRVVRKSKAKLDRVMRPLQRAGKL